ncbi:MAG: magnesium transporter [Planctomycetota bacterium]|jgi:magnesium transporter
MAEEEKRFVEDIEVLLDAGNKEGLREYLQDLLNSEISEVVELFDNDRRRSIFDVLDRHTSAEVLEKVDEATRAELFEILGDEELLSIVSELDADDAADVLSEMEEEDVAEVLESMPEDESEEILRLMKYSEDSAGGIMDPILISVPEDATVSEAVNEIRAAEIDEDFYSVFVVDKESKFLGDVRIRLLLTSREDVKIKELIDPEIIYVRADADQEEVRNIFSKNDLIVIPVLDTNDKLIGRITADRIIEVAEEEAAEDMYVMAGTDPDELDDVSVVRAARIRMTWLLPCMLGTAITALVMMFFRTNYHIVFVAAAAFVPMIAAISGNAGLQTSTIVVSGLATGHLAALRLRQVLSREVRIAFIVAVSCGIIGGLICAVLIHYHSTGAEVGPIRLIIAFGTAMFSAIMVATTLGLYLPFLFRKVGIDPAISSGPLVTTANDSISVAIYLTLALLTAGKMAG